MGRLFGTDGARGVANRELTCELAMDIGRAAAKVLISSQHRRPKVLVGKDTRASGDMLETALAEFQALRNKYAILVELAELFDVIDELQTKYSNEPAFPPVRNRQQP